MNHNTNRLGTVGLGTLLRIALCALFWLSFGQAQAQSCHFNLKFKLANGETVCLNTQKFATETPRKQQGSIERLARNTNNYYLAKSVDERCQSWGFGDVAAMVTSINDKISPPKSAFDNAKKSAISECESTGCQCQILIDDGTANSAHPDYANLFDKGAPNQATRIAGTAASGSKPPSLTEEQRIAAEVKARLDALLAAELAQREAQRLAAEAKAREEQRLAAEAKAREEQRVAAESKAREEQRLAAEAGARETLRLAEARARDEQRQAAEAQAREEQRLASEAKKEQEMASLRAELERMRRQTAQTEVSTVLARRKALVIGNDAYKHISPLSKAVADAKAMAESLEKVGYTVTLRSNLTEREMKTTLRTFKSEVEAGDEVTFFFAGHGVEIAKENYLIPIDVAGDNPDQVRDETIALQRILDDMSEKKVKLTLALVDACRNNPFKSNGRAIGSGRGLAPTTPATGQMVVFSAGTGQEALDVLGPGDKNKNGVFTRVFIREMLKPDRTVDTVTREVREEVVRLAKSVNHDQVPAIYDQVVGKFYFSRTGAR
jgi:chemotaxis protein histidine kinase CheA